MDDISVLRDVWGEVEPSSPDARARARTALQGRIDQASTPRVPHRRPPARLPARRRTWAWGVGIATVAASVAAGVIVVVTPTHAPSTGGVGPAHPPVAAAPAGAMDLAAAYAAAQPFTEPRPDQWAYIELSIGVNGSPTTTRRSWYRIDGTQIAIPGPDGKIQITTHPEDQGRVGPKPTLNPHDYPTLAAMPRQPQALLTFLEAGLEPVADPNLDRSASLFGLIAYILRENVLPPAVTAALLRAAALIPGVAEVPEPVTADGRTMTAVGKVDGWSREEILLDPVTKEFLGSRSVAIADTPAPTQVPGGGVVVRWPAAHAGDVLYLITRGTCTIVDSPGQTG